VNTDIPKGLLEDVEKYIIQLKTRIDEVEEMLTNNRI
jgi:NADH:ubiquinone oxidoreductase subunit D